MSLLLYSCGSSIIAEYEECIAQNNLELAGVVRNLKSAPVYSRHSNIIDSADITEAHQTYRYLVPIFAPKIRFTVHCEAINKGLIPFALLSYSHNCIASDFIHGHGCFINAAVVIGASTQIGHCVVINRGVSIGHHVNLENFVSIGPSATLCGNVSVGTGAMIGAGAVILPKIKIGAHSRVGAGAVVTKHVKEGEVVIGNPARYVKEVAPSDFFYE